MKKYFKITALLVIGFMGMATTIGNQPNDKYFEMIKNIEIFTNLYKEINTYYVDEVDPGKLMRTGLDAMMESLDPYTNYISESDIEGYRFLTDGKYNGIGARSKKMGDYVTITELYKDQPADRAGLRPGDQIVAIDGNDTKGKSGDAINALLRGFPNTTVQIAVRRPGTKELINLTLTRGEVQVPNVPYSGMVRDDIGYVSLTTFTRNAGMNVKNAIQKLKKENPSIKGVIFDLRDNGGGLLNEAVNISNIFIPKGELVVKTKGKVKDWDMSFRTTTTPLDTEIPLVILINGRSASASEIVSGVIQDYDRGVLLGQRSYGKGLVQNTKDIGYNAKLKLTTAKYYIPSERCIQSVEYEDGEPVDIADEKRTPFKTRNGRTVLDGGGVKPDIFVNKVTDVGVIKSLVDQNLIFDYVTDYCLKRDSIKNIEAFRFTEINEFLSFLESKNFQYQTESEKLISQLEKMTSKEGYDLDTSLKSLSQKVKAAKKDEILRYKEEITKLIEKEIASRYFYQKGKIKMGLRNDIEIEEAVKVINDSSRYNQLLGNR
jgi:carboxyl-terminal processing protease